MGADTREDIINFTEADRYVAPTEPEVIKKLEWFKDQKLAFMVHWGKKVPCPVFRHEPHIQSHPLRSGRMGGFRQ